MLRIFQTMALAGICLCFFNTLILTAEPAQTQSTVNLLANGSFELGLGAEPFYPGWVSSGTGKRVPVDAPPLVSIDRTQAHDGQASLHWANMHGHNRAVLELACPDIDPNLPHTITLWARASRPGVRLVMGSCSLYPFGPVNGQIKGAITTSWTQFTGVVTSTGPYAFIRMECSSGSDESYDLWIDQITWTQQSQEQSVAARPVDIVLIPQTRTDMRWADGPLVMQWSAQSSSSRHVQMQLQLTDLTRDSVQQQVWQDTISLTSEVTTQRITLKPIKRGAYLAHLYVKDATTGEHLATAVERFTVMTNLANVPSPIGFDVGMRDNLVCFSQGQPASEFNWRGYWDVNEFYQLCHDIGFRVPRLMIDWQDIEPQQGKFDWFVDAQLQSAAQHGCTPFLTFPTEVPNLSAEQWQDIQNKLPTDQRARKRYGHASRAPQWLQSQLLNISDQSTRGPMRRPLNDPSKWRVVCAPPANALADVCKAVAGRYADQILGIELINEINLYIQPQAAIDHYFKVAYPAIKSVAPDLPVWMDQTADYSADGQGYTASFLQAGGGAYIDGITHHPYGSYTLGQGGLAKMKSLKAVVNQYATADHPLTLGQSEIHSIGRGGYIAGWEIMQRALIDWALGNRFSAGTIMDSAFFLEGGPRRGWLQRGARAPAAGAVAVNGMYTVLGGARCTGYHDWDGRILAVLFHTSSRNDYTVAITTQNNPLAQAMFDVDFSGMQVQAFDQWGQPMPINLDRAIALNRDVLYLRSTDSQLFDRIRQAKVQWSQRLAGDCDVDQNEEYSVNRDPVKLARLARTGMPPHWHVGGVVSHWQLAPIQTLQGDWSNNLQAVLDRAFGSTSPSTSIDDRDLGYVVFPTSSSTNSVAWCAKADIHADQAGVEHLQLTATQKMFVWVNGALAATYTPVPDQPLGRQCLPMNVLMNRGVNQIVVLMLPEGGPCAFALSNVTQQQDAGIDSQGYFQQWLMVGPWENPRDVSGNFLGNQQAFPPESDPSTPRASMLYHGLAGRPLLWHTVQTQTSSVRHPWENAVSYAYTTFELDTDFDGIISLGSDDGFALWVDSNLIQRANVARGLRLDSDQLPIKLSAGQHTMMLKIDDVLGGGGFAVRLLNQDKTPMLQVRVKP